MACALLVQHGSSFQALSSSDIPAPARGGGLRLVQDRGLPAQRQEDVLGMYFWKAMPAAFETRSTEQNKSRDAVSNCWPVRIGNDKPPPTNCAGLALLHLSITPRVVLGKPVVMVKRCRRVILARIQSRRPHAA